MLNSQDVISAYKLILGREPESLAIIESYVRHADFDGLRRTLLSSGEFAERLSRDPSLLAVPIVALSMTDEVRLYQGLLETLVGLELSLWDRSALIVGNNCSSLAGYFLDRRCKVSIATSSETAAFFQRLLQSHPLYAANTSLLSLDFSRPVDEENSQQFDLVYGELPDDSSDVMRTWLDNAAEACTGTLIVTCCTAPGRSEGVFLTSSALPTARFRTVPSKKWMYARLRERFEHIYEPAHIASPTSLLQGRPAGIGETRATWIASRSALTSPALAECVPTAAPSRRAVTERAKVPTQV